MKRKKKKLDLDLEIHRLSQAVIMGDHPKAEGTKCFEGGSEICRSCSSSHDYETIQQCRPGRRFLHIS